MFRQKVSHGNLLHASYNSLTNSFVRVYFSFYEYKNNCISYLIKCSLVLMRRHMNTNAGAPPVLTLDMA